MAVRYIQRSFGGGEISPDMYGRSDDQKYVAGLSTCLNFITRPQGPAENRPGLRFVCAAKYAERAVRLLPFTFSTTQTMVLECGHEYIRFHTQAATLLPGTPETYYPSAAATLTLATTTKSGAITIDTPYRSKVTITVGTPGSVTWTNHGLLDNDQLRFTSSEPKDAEVTIDIPTSVMTWAGHALLADSMIRFSTTGALPTGLTAGTTYYVRDVTTDTFKVSASVGGAAIALSGTQSGAHTGAALTTQDAEVTIAIDKSAVTWIGHELPSDTQVVFSTTGALPTGLTAGTTYYVRDVTLNTFKLSTSSGGAAIALSGTQSGAHTCTATIAATISGTLPTGLTAGNLYYVRYPSADAFYVSDTKDGSYLALSDPQSGTHTATKSRPIAGTINWEQHQLPDGTPVAFTSTGNLPSGLKHGVTYYVCEATPDTFRVAAAVGGAAIETSGTQTGTHTCTATIPAPVTVGLTGHWLAAGNRVALTTTGTLPTGLTAGQAYYVSSPAANTFKLAAESGGTELSASGTQSGTHTLHRAYRIGDQVSYGGAHYYCIADSQGHLPTDTAYWYAQPSTVYEIPSPYQEADLPDLHYVQSNDVLTIVHPGYHPKELRRLGASNWTLTDTVFGSVLTAPTGVTVGVRDCSETRYTNIYCVTATQDDANHESAASVEVSVKSNLYETGCTNVIQWQAVTVATGYRVYKQNGGLFGLIGSTTTELRLVDDNITPDLSLTPPRYDDTLAGTAGDYPGAVSYFEQRRVLAGTTNKPQNLWMTKSGTESDLSYSLPVRDDDRIAFRVAAREANTIRHVVPLTQLLLLTSGGEWRVTGGSGDVLTPSNITVRPQSYIGASNVQPCIVNNAVIYGAARGGHVQELTYNWQADGFVTGDLSLRAAHLFDGFQIVDMAFAKAPQPIVWCVSSTGQLYGLTYLPEQQVGGWHRHETDGVFEACCVVAEGEYDALYVVVRRTINGADMRYIERLDPRVDETRADAFFVDSGLTYDGVPADTISGLWHLEGQTVAILADGGAHPTRVVQGGAVQLDIEASVVQVGLPYQSTLATLPLAVEIDTAMGQGRPKGVTKAWVRVSSSAGVFVGPSVDRLTEAKQRTTEPYGVAPWLVTGELEVVLSPEWSRDGTVVVQQSYPLPLTVVSLVAEVIIGS